MQQRTGLVIMQASGTSADHLDKGTTKSEGIAKDFEPSEDSWTWHNSLKVQLGITLLLCVLIGCAVLMLVVGSGGSGLVWPRGKQGTSQTNKEDTVKLDEVLEFSAIKALHSQLDDNRDGTVDQKESEDFVHTELHENSNKRSKQFHQTDLEITSEDLWQAWKQNKGFAWKNEDVVDWLVNTVKLPKYADSFRRHNIRGRHLPWLADNTKQILQAVLLISDAQHRAKIQLKAMDVVLFGPTSSSSSWLKDAVLVLLVILLGAGLFAGLKQRYMAQAKIDHFLSNMAKHEMEIADLRERLEQNTDGNGSESEGDGGFEDTLTFERSASQQDDAMSVSTESSYTSSVLEVEHLKEKVWQMESAAQASAQRLDSLQCLLEQCCLRERDLLDSRKREAEEEMLNAQKVCDKIKKKRSTLIGTFRVASSSALEDAGLLMTKAVNDLQRISDKMDEFRERWSKVEEACGYPVTPESLHSHHQHQHQQQHCSSGSGSGGQKSQRRSRHANGGGGGGGGGATRPPRLHPSTMMRVIDEKSSVTTPTSGGGLTMARRRPSVRSESDFDLIAKRGGTTSRRTTVHNCESPKRPASSCGINIGGTRNSSRRSTMSSPIHTATGSPFDSAFSESDLLQGSASKMHYSASVPVFVRKPSYTEAVDTCTSASCSTSDQHSSGRALGSKSNVVHTILERTTTMANNTSNPPVSSGGSSSGRPVTAGLTLSRTTSDI